MSDYKNNYDVITNLADIRSSRKSTKKVSLQEYINSLNKFINDTNKTFHLDEIDYNFTLPKTWNIDDINFSGLAKRAEECISLISCPQNICKQLSKCASYSEADSYLLSNDLKIISSITTEVKDNNDFCKHVQEAVIAYNNGLYRASQSCSVIAIDSKLQDASEFKEWKIDSGRPKTRLANNAFNYIYKNFVDKNKDKNNERPAYWPSNHEVPFYVICLLESIMTFECEPFEINNKETWDKKYLNRHMSVHTTSSQQYSKSHALMAIMLACDLNYVEKNYDKKWFEKILKSYEIIKEE